MQRKWIDQYILLLYSGVLNHANQYKCQHMPSSLFRYEKVEPCRLTSLEKSEIYLSSPKHFNDKYDTKGLYYSENFLASIYDRFQVDPTGFKVIFDQILDDYYTHCGIACLTEDRNNYPMWWSYADDYKGFCIEYDIGTLAAENSKTLEDLHPIIYLEEKFNFDVLLTALTENIKEDEPNVTPAMLLFHRFLGTMKHISWQYEKEWRFIKILQQGGIKSPAKIKAIYLGCNFDTNNIAPLEKIATEQNFNIFQLSTSGYTQKSFSFIEKRL